MSSDGTADIRALFNRGSPAKRPRVAPLWQEALKATFSALLQEHPDEVVELLSSDVQLARRLVQESSCKLRRLPLLADCDTIEILQLPPRKLGDKNTPYCSNHYSLRTADLPYQLRAVLKDLFYEAMSEVPGPATRGLEGIKFGKAEKMPDGTVNVRIDLIKRERDRTACLWGHQWLRILEQYAEQHDVPDNEEAGSKWDDVSIGDRFSQLQPHTLEYDAYDYWINENDDRMEHQFAEIFHSFFGAKEPWSERMAKSTGGESWTQRPRLRIVITGSMKSSFPLPLD